MSVLSAAVREHRIDLAGLPFRHLECGPPAGLLVVILHALGAGADDWLDVARALSDRWRVIALDQRGHVGSARPGAYSFELMRDDLAAFVDHLGLVQPILLGHSMGGTVAYLYAEAFPDRVGKLVIVDTRRHLRLSHVGPNPTQSPTTRHSTAESWCPSSAS